MRRLTLSLLMASVCVLTAHTETVKFHLATGCTLPFASIAPAHDVFASCDNDGQMAGHAIPAKAKILESDAKNNLCADTSEIVPMHFEDFSRLEANTDPAQLNLHASRSELAIVRDVVIHGSEVGEGTIVQLVAMMRGAHISDCGSTKPGQNGGEAVNCNRLGLAKNDIHIVLMPLGADEHASECESVTAEMIPHFRPSAWSQVDLKTPTQNPVRLTGQLFYDNSHRACVNGKGSPARRTVWEIHPLYQFDVCKSTNAADCDAATDASWVPYDQWVTRAGAVTTATGKKQRQACESAAAHHP